MHTAVYLDNITFKFSVGLPLAHMSSNVLMRKPSFGTPWPDLD